MSNDQHHLVIHAPNFPLAIGAIGPDQRIASGEITASNLNRFLEQLGQYFIPIAAEGRSIPAQCVDGRSRKDGSYEPAPKAAAGTFSAVIGDALTNASYRQPHTSAATHAKTVYAYLLRHGYVGGHDADHTSGQGCGCGAEDKLQEILTFIRDKGDAIKAFLADVGVAIDDETHRLIVSQATKLLEEQYVVPGAELRDAYIEVAGKDSVETLTGPHHEVALVVNTEAGTTIDRAKLAESYGDSLQVFELDVPSLQVAADALSISEHEAAQKFAAMLYYNVATAAVLADKSLRIAVR